MTIGPAHLATSKFNQPFSRLDGKIEGRAPAEQSDILGQGQNP